MEVFLGLFHFANQEVRSSPVPRCLPEQRCLQGSGAHCEKGRGRPWRGRRGAGGGAPRLSRPSCPLTAAGPAPLQLPPCCPYSLPPPGNAGRTSIPRLQAVPPRAPRRASAGPAPAGWAAQRSLAAARTPAPEQRNAGRGRGAQAAMQSRPKSRPGRSSGPTRGPRRITPRPPSPTGPREERGAPLEVTIGRWRYAAPCRSRAPGPRSKVDQGLTTGALEQYQLLGKRLQLFGVI